MLSKVNDQFHEEIANSYETDFNTDNELRKDLKYCVKNLVQNSTDPNFFTKGNKFVYENSDVNATMITNEVLDHKTYIEERWPEKINLSPPNFTVSLKNKKVIFEISTDKAIFINSLKTNFDYTQFHNIDVYLYNSNNKTTFKFDNLCQNFYNSFSSLSNSNENELPFLWVTNNNHFPLLPGNSLRFVFTFGKVVDYDKHQVSNMTLTYEKLESLDSDLTNDTFIDMFYVLNQQNTYFHPRLGTNIFNRFIKNHYQNTYRVNFNNNIYCLLLKLTEDVKLINLSTIQVLYGSKSYMLDIIPVFNRLDNTYMISFSDDLTVRSINEMGLSGSMQLIMPKIFEGKVLSISALSSNILKKDINSTMENSSYTVKYSETIVEEEKLPWTVRIPEYFNKKFDPENKSSFCESFKNFKKTITEKYYKQFNNEEVNTSTDKTNTESKTLDEKH